MTKHQTRITDKPIFLAVLALAAVLVLFNQWQIGQISALTRTSSGNDAAITSVLKKANVVKTSSGDLADADLSGIQNTAQSIAALFPLDKIKTAQDAVDVMIPTGTPDYGKELGISYDDPINSLRRLQQLYYTYKDEIQQNKPEVWQRYLNLATKPVGISCEFCCGVGPVGITNNGRLRCGCSHNVALQALTMWLMDNTGLTDAEILREGLRWKALWFPRNMVGIAAQLAGGDTSALQQVPGMVGGC